MKTILILYIILINISGFALMGIDKRRAIRKKWRISERALLLTALFCGSIGVMTGMYVFHHKTKHAKFTIGVPAILILQLLLIGSLYYWNNKRMGSPSSAVENELALIQTLDPDTISSFVSYENLTNPQLATGNVGEEATEAVRLFFKNFEYHIHNEEIDNEKNTATVSVTITNLDMKALATDVCTAILRESVDLYPDKARTTPDDYYQLLYDTLSDNHYEEVVTTAYFHLQKDKTGWIILADQTLEDELVSGFISYMNDPYLLSANATLSVHMDALADLTTEQWRSLLSVNDIFSTYNTDYASLIDDAYLAQLTSSFHYEILRCSEDGSKASAVVRITSINMTDILNRYKKYLLEYAATTKSIRDDDVQVSNETASLLLKAIQENTTTKSTDVDMSFQNNGTFWDISYNDAFTNALMGDMTSALAAFQ